MEKLYDGITLTIDEKDGIATVALNRPNVLNALDRKMYRGLYELIPEIEAEKSVRVVILTGTGRAFCAGSNVQDMMVDAGSLSVAEKERVLNRAPDQLILRLARMNKPTIAAVNGVAVGGGAALTVACDMRIASETARFGFVFIKRGLSSADMGCTWFLPRIVGSGWANELLYTGDIVDAQLAERIKLVNRVVPSADLMAVTRELALKIAANPPLGVMMTKRALILEATSDLAAGLEYEAAVQTFCHLTKDHEEGVASFKEKRDARFIGE